MRQNNLIRILAIGSLLLGLYACSDGESSSDVVAPPSSSAGGSSAGGSSGGDSPDVSSSSLADSVEKVRTIDEHGDTVYIVIKDTTVVQDTTPHWVGNSALVITEILPVNLSWQDENGDDPAWVEIYNAGNEAANLKGYALVESREKPRKWVFGDEIIAAKSFRIVFCDKKNVVEIPDGGETDGKHFRLHTNWKVEKEGGTVYLIDKLYGIRDSVAYPAINKGDVSWGITDGGIWKYFDKPTPEAPNTNSKAYDAVAPTIDLSQLGGGFHNDRVTINPPSLPSGVKLRCTENGSIPNANSPEFNSQKTFDKSTPFRCIVSKEGAISTQVVTKTFFVGETVSMPVVAISVDPSFFEKVYIKTDASSPKSAPSGLYEEIEYPVHVEYFPKGSNSSKAAWEIDASISLMGGYSRLNDKKSVAIEMHEEYQNGRLHYPLFDTRKSDSVFKAFNLRNNGNRFVSDYIEDAMGGALLEGSGVDYQRSRQVVVFYNGKYYGIHDMRERFNRAYVETNYGIDAKSVEMVKHLGGLDEITASGDGSIDNYVNMLQFIGGNDMKVAENYEQAKTLIDIGNFADYMAAEIYYHNGDWPNNNVRAWRSPEHPWKFMVYDLDHGFDWMWGVNGGEFSQGNNMFAWIEQGGGNKKCPDVGCFASLYNSLIKNEDFKRLFLNHSAVMLHDYVNGANVEKIVDKMVATIDQSEMVRDLEHFKQDQKYYRNSCDDGFSKTGSCIKSWAKERDSKVLEEYRGKFFKDGGGDLVTVKINSNGSGTVLMEGMKLPSTKYDGKFFNGIQMELTAVPSNGAVFGGWSGCTSVSEDHPEICRATITDGLTISATFK